MPVSRVLCEAVPELEPGVLLTELGQLILPDYILQHIHIVLSLLSYFYF